MHVMRHGREGREGREGLGWLGVTLARNLHGLACITLTEQEEGEGVSWLQHNVDLNQGQKGVDKIQVAPCDWNDYANPSRPAPALGPICPATGRPWDFLIGSDLIYTEGGCQALPKVLRALATSGCTQILYCHTLHRFDYLDLMLSETLRTSGLGMQEIHEEGVPTPPASPPPLTELFPEMRIGVFRIGEIGPLLAEGRPLRMALSDFSLDDARSS